MFSEDLKKGRKAEREFAKVLLDRGASNISLAPDVQFKSRDIIADNSTYEVKDDIISKLTGNVWFEYLCNDDVSWIYASKADYIVYHLDDRFYCVPRGKLLVWLEFVSKEKKKWWDGDRANLFIVKKPDFLDFVNRQWWISD